MKTIYLILTLFVAGQAFGDTLPDDVSEILTKLEDFETEQRDKTEMIISQKRTEVAAFLQRALDRETRSGNLEVALAIKARIARLSTIAADSSPPTDPEPIPEDWSSERSFARWLETIEVWDEGGELVRYVKDGSVVTFNETKNKEIPREAKIEGQRVEWIFEGDNSTVFALDFSSPSEVEITLKSGKRVGIIRPRDPSRR